MNGAKLPHSVSGVAEICICWRRDVQYYMF